MIGKKLAHFEITAKLGEGGMGEVYRATDSKLGREVALKVLPESLASDPERLARFDREAKVLASLNHPGIAAIYSFEEAEGVRFLTMELVQGESLDVRIAKAPPTIEETVEIARQMAIALEAAHELGVVHRDLKPANVMVTPEDEVKILDFGLAKAMEPPAGADALLSQSPTITHQMTQAGTLMGTAAYMSPEQARGQEADKRSDVWSFGVVLYEMLTGGALFSGDTVSDTLAAVLRAEPELEQLPAGVPPRLRALLGRCLEKGPKLRLRDIGEARIALAEAGDGHLKGWGADAPTAASDTNRWLTPIALVAGLAIGAALAGLLARPRGPAPERSPVVRFEARHPVPEADHLIAPHIAPDGSWIVYLAADPDAYRLYLRKLDETEVRALPGTEGAISPFASPDSNWVAFFAGGKIHKVPVDGGSPSEVGSVGPSPGGHWGADGYIYYSTWVSGLSRIDVESGQIETVTKPLTGELGHWWPQLLPGEDGLLFTIWDRGTGSLNDTRIVHLDLASGRQTQLARGAAAQYTSSGHLVYQRAGVWVAAEFDLESVTLSERTRTVLPDVPPLDPTGQSNHYFSIAANGTLAYASKQDLPFHLPQRLVWIDRSGAVEELPFAPAQYGSGRLFPDERSLVIARKDNGKWDLWRLDLERETEQRITDEANNLGPVLHADGKTVAFETVREGSMDVFSAVLDSDERPAPLVDAPEDVVPYDWSPDGKYLLYGIDREATETDVMLLDVEARDSRPFVEEPGRQRYARFSPDGRWVAYISDRSGRREVLVRPFPGPGPQVQVSTGGGFAQWARNAKIIYVWRGNDLVEVEYGTVPGGAGVERFVSGAERSYFAGTSLDEIPRRNDIAIPTSGRILAATREPEPQLRVHVVVGGLQQMVASLEDG